LTAGLEIAAEVSSTAAIVIGVAGAIVGFVGQLAIEKLRDKRERDLAKNQADRDLAAENAAVRRAASS
jgi:hypothetical protein